MSPAVWERLDLAIEAFEAADQMAQKTQVQWRTAMQVIVSGAEAAQHVDGETITKLMTEARIARELCAQGLLVAAKRALDDHDKDQLAEAHPNE